jgi:uncharacterized SAM-binding protein YcdF (DUF218 family)
LDKIRSRGSTVDSDEEMCQTRKSREVDLYDLGIVLGTQIIRKKNRQKMVAVDLSFDAEVRARAAGIAYRQRMVPRFLLSGGYNVGTRYDDKVGRLFARPDLSFEAISKARFRSISEAYAMYCYMRREHDVPRESFIFEEHSTTTRENAQFSSIILARYLEGDQQGTDLSKLQRIGLITQLYHMERAVKEFRNMGLMVDPLFAEDLLALDGDKKWVTRIAEYYVNNEKEGKKWDADMIFEVLTERIKGDFSRSIGELLKSKWYYV